MNADRREMGAPRRPNASDPAELSAGSNNDPDFARAPLVSDVADSSPSSRRGSAMSGACLHLADDDARQVGLDAYHCRRRRVVPLGSVALGQRLAERLRDIKVFERAHGTRSSEEGRLVTGQDNDEKWR